MKLYDKKEIVPIALILVIFAVGLYLSPQLPERLPSHWNIYNQVDGWVSRDFAIFFFPGLILVLYVLLSFLPLMDPLKVNIELFGHLYFWFKMVFLLFMGMLYILTLFAGLGYQLNIGRVVTLGIAALFLFIGYIMPKIKKNYTIGIRLPWTLHSEVVWERTHKFAGKLFMVLAGLIAIASFLPGAYTFGILMFGIVSLLAVLFGYAYYEYRSIERKKKL